MILTTEIDKCTPGFAHIKEIYLTTYHAAKGLEFDNVFVPFLTSDKLPDSDTVSNAISKDSAYCLVQITELLLSEDKKAATKLEVTEVKSQGSDWKITPIGKMRFIGSKSVHNGTNGFVIIETWQPMLGQTLYI